jgi:hypothetical protein
MRKLLLIVMLGLSTLAWAHGAKNMKQQSQTGNDWYQAQLNSQIDSSVRFNQTIAPSATAFAEREPGAFQQPSSMAAREGGGGDDWYNQKLKIQNEVNRRDLQSLK